MESRGIFRYALFRILLSVQARLEQGHHLRVLRRIGHEWNRDLPCLPDPRDILHLLRKIGRFLEQEPQRFFCHLKELKGRRVYIDDKAVPIQHYNPVLHLFNENAPRERDHGEELLLEDSESEKKPGYPIPDRREILAQPREEIEDIDNARQEGDGDSKDHENRLECKRPVSEPKFQYKDDDACQGEGICMNRVDGKPYSVTNLHHRERTDEAIGNVRPDERPTRINTYENQGDKGNQENRGICEDRESRFPGSQPEDEDEPERGKKNEEWIRCPCPE